MSKEIENAIEETISKGFEFKLGLYFSDGWDNCKNVILPNWGFMTLAVIISIFVGMTPFIGVFVLIGYIIPALMAGLFYYIHYGLIGGNTFGDFFKGFFNANIIGYVWLVSIVSLLISIPSIIYSYSLGLYDPIIKNYELFASGGFEIEKLLVLSQDLKVLKDSQGMLYKVISYSTLIVSTTFSISQFIGFPILVSSNMIGPIQALVYSFRLCIKKFWWLMLLYVILAFMNYLGAILFTFGLIITIPFSAGIVYSIFKTVVLSKLDYNQTVLSGDNDLLDT